MLYKLWQNEEELHAGYETYAEHYVHVADEVEGNARCFNFHAEAMESAIDQLAANGPPQCVWDTLAPAAQEDNAATMQAEEVVLSSTQGMDDRETQGLDLECGKMSGEQMQKQHSLSQLYEHTYMTVLYSSSTYCKSTLAAQKCNIPGL